MGERHLFLDVLLRAAVNRMLKQGVKNPDGRECGNPENLGHRHGER